MKKKKLNERNRIKKAIINIDNYGSTYLFQKQKKREKDIEIY